MSGDWPRAIEIYSTLMRSHLDDIEHGLSLARAQTSSGKAWDAYSTLEQLRRLAAPASDDARIDLAEAHAAMALTDYQRERQAAERAAAKAAAQGARGIIAKARIAEGWAWRNLGDSQKASSALEEARILSAATGDVITAAKALNPLAVVLWDQGKLREARLKYEESLAFFKQTGSRYDTGLALHNIALVQLDLGEAGEAQEKYEASLAIFQEIGRKGAAASALNGIGELLRFKGDLQRSIKHHDEALTLSRSVGDQRSEAIALTNLGECLIAQGELTAARVRYEQAAAIRARMSNPWAQAQSRIALSTLSMEEGRFDDALDLARQAVTDFQTAKRWGDQLHAVTVMGQILLAQNKLEESRAAIRLASALLSQTHNARLRLRTELIQASLDIAAGNTGSASKGIDRTAAEARSSGFFDIYLEAQLVRAQALVKSANSAAALEALRMLERGAAGKGFTLIAAKARGAAGKISRSM
jgi:tetratricopeptide (TPR) repeat protein